MHKSLLVISISLALGASPGMAEEEHPEGTRHLADLERILVRALPLQRSALESAQPIEVLAGEALDDRRGMTLGETLQLQPGVHSTAYGAGSGRPIIRGLSGPRVRILDDGLSTADASAPSDDHAVTVDPMLVDQIEILRGPATLLYGSGASGGVVNVVDNRIPEQVPDTPISGRFELRGDTVADERSGALSLDGGGGNFAWHVDGSWRDSDDYDIPSAARRDLEDDHGDDPGHDDDHDDDHDDNYDRTLFNSFVESRSGTIGASWIGERGFIGASFRRFETEYGIPAAHGHSDHDDDEHGHDNGHDNDLNHDDEDDEFAFIDMEQNDWDLKAGLLDPLPGFTRATLRLGYNDYTHREIELEEHGRDNDNDDGHSDDHDDDHDHEATVFDVETWQARLALETVPLAGWEGAIGIQYDHEDFTARGEEAFVPPNETDSLAIFALQEQRFGDLTLSIGGRVERNQLDAKFDDHDDEDEHVHDDEHDDDDHADIDSRTFTNWSASIGAIWHINDLWQSSLNFSRAQRAPSATELFADGPHLATFSFERGDPTLGKETSNAWDLGLHRHSEQFDFELNLFHKDIRNFIFLDDTGEELDGLPLRFARQNNAEIYGFEALGTWQIHGTGMGDFDLTGAYDLVRGKLDGDSNLPRMSPQRLRLGLDWHRGAWRAGTEWVRVFRQDRVADNESETPGYNLFNARVAYSFNLNRADLEVFAEGRNLGDNEARVHTSFLKEFTPLPGRNVRLGLRGRF